MNEGTMNHYFATLGNSGPEWIIAGAIVLMIGYIAVKIVPIIKESKQKRDDAYIRKIDSDIELEKSREQRKVEETRARERRDIERSESEGRWIQLTEQIMNITEKNNQIEEAMVLSMDGLREDLKESRMGSREMQKSVNYVKNKVDELYGKVDSMNSKL